MASKTDKDEVIELDEELETNYSVYTKEQKPGSSAKFQETEGQSQELLIANFERVIHHLNSCLEEKKENESLIRTLFEKQLIEKDREIKKLQKRAAAELDAHKKEIQNLKSENQKLTELASCNNDARTEINKMMSEKEEEIRKLQKEAAAKLETHKKEMQSLKCENLQLTNELSSSKNDAKTELNEMMTVKEEAIQNLQNEKARTASVEQQLKEMLATMTAGKKLEEKVKETEQRIKLQQSENSDPQQQIAGKKTQYEEIRREKLQKEELDPNKKEIQSLKNLLENNQSLRKLNQVDVQSNLSDNSTYLIIKDRTINYLAPGTFDNLSSLTYLNFDGSGLTFLEKGVFNNLINLITLKVPENYLTCLEENVFAGLKKLKTISLFNNKITKLPSQLFRGLESLEHIYLSWNKISVFDDDLLVGLNRLTYFNAEKNNLTSIPEKLFEDCVKLEQVWLNNNRIVRWKNTSFQGLHNLKLLNLQNNRWNENVRNVFNALNIKDLRI